MVKFDEKFTFIVKTSGVNDGFRKNPDSLSGICMNSLMEAQFHIVSENWRKQYEVKKM